MRMLMSYSWPGNIRELENMMERGVLLTASDQQIELKHLFAGVAELLPEDDQLSLQGKIDVSKSSVNTLIEQVIKEGISLESCEWMFMEAALKKTGGNVSKAAELLGVTRRQVAYRLEKEDKK